MFKCIPQWLIRDVTVNKLLKNECITIETMVKAL